MNVKLTWIATLVAFLFLPSVFFLNAQTSKKRELRGIWITTVGNLDWPKTTTPEAQKAEMIVLLDKLQEAKINAAFVQVRTSCDALYSKSIEPWSEFISGEQGKNPGYDPLEFIIKEGHKRGIEIHAWLNLSRAVYKTASSISEDHVSKTHPDWIVDYVGEKWLNLGIPEVQQHITAVVKNLVQNYEIDGIQFDDYFYPYPKKIEDELQVFEDKQTFQQYKSQFTCQKEWRRNNVNELIKEIHHTINKTNPKVKFGISSFGIWKNKKDDDAGSDSHGLSSFSDLYADCRLWAEKGWIDYLAPQVYWSTEFLLANYETLVDWWSKNTYGKHLYIGQAIYKIGGGKAMGKDLAWNNPEEFSKQIRINRSKQTVSGNILFRADYINKNPLGLLDTLKRLNAYYALVPTMSWKDNISPEMPLNLKPSLTNEKAIKLTWETPNMASDGDLPKEYVVYRFDNKDSMDLENPANILGKTINTTFNDITALPNTEYIYLVVATDKLNNESEPSNAVRVLIKGI